MIKFEIDRKTMSDFQRALKLYQEATQKDVPAVINRAAMNVAFRAAQFTHKSDPQKIIALATGTYVTPQGRVLAGEARARALIIGRLRKAGRPIPPKGELQKKINAFIAGKIRRAFIAGGWLKAARKFQAVVRASKPRGVVIKGISPRRGIGGGTLARQALISFAEIVNASTSKSPTSERALFKHGGEGLRQAIVFVANDMREYALDLLRRNARRFNRG